MNWITNYVRPKINSMLGRREMPENLWIKDPETGEMVFHKDLESNQFVIPSSGHHMKISARERLKFFFDEGTFEVLENPKVPVDPLKFRDEKRYTDRLREAKAKTGLEDAIVTALGSDRRTSDRGHCPGFRFHGRLARHGGRRGDRPRLRDGNQAEAAAGAFRGIRRRAHAGRHPVADAACRARRSLSTG